jgi:hypothetical protein
MARSQLISQASLEAMLKYAPQKNALSELKQQAEENFAGSAQAARSAGELGVTAAREAVPAVTSTFQRAAKDQTATRTRLAGELGALAPAANGFKSAAATEAAGAQDSLGRERAQALTQLHTQALAAASGAQYATGSAQSTLAKELQKIFGQTQQVAGEEGSFAAASAGKQNEQAQTLAQRERSSERSSGIDPNTGKPIPGGKLDKHANSLLPTKEQDAAGSTIDEIKQYAQRFRQAGASRGSIIARLTEGEPETTQGTGKKDASGKEVKVKVPSLPSFKPDPLMSAALDVVEFGHLQKGTQANLQKAGYSIKTLGLPSYGEWKNAKYFLNGNPVD